MTAASLKSVWNSANTSLAILAQLLLALDRRDLANSTYATAKRIGNDSTLVQAIEAWIGLKTVSPPCHRSPTCSH